jgi:hypothetical protein
VIRTTRMTAAAVATTTMGPGTDAAAEAAEATATEATATVMEGAAERRAAP